MVMWFLNGNKMPSKKEIIYSLLKNGLAAELLSILQGDSRFSDSASLGAPEDRMLARLWIAAQYHLEFISIFGNENYPREFNGRVISPFPEDFEKWIEIGAPGLTDLEVERLSSLL